MHVDDHDSRIGPTPPSGALPRSAAKCARPCDLHTPLRKRLLFSVYPADTTAGAPAGCVSAHVAHTSRLLREHSLLRSKSPRGRLANSWQSTYTQTPSFHADAERLFPAVLMRATYISWLWVLLPASSFEHGLLWQAACTAPGSGVGTPFARLLHRALRIERPQDKMSRRKVTADRLGVARLPSST